MTWLAVIYLVGYCISWVIVVRAMYKNEVIYATELESAIWSGILGSAIALAWPVFLPAMLVTRGLS